MKLNEEIRSVLEAGGFRTALSPKMLNEIYFEDATIAGVVFLYETVCDLVAKWESKQDSFLGTNSRAIRSDPIKAWNIYTVHLTADLAMPSQLSVAFNIEQDFRGTRKIVRTGLSKKADVKEALLSLLPLQHKTSISPTGIVERLRERLKLSSPSLEKLIDQSNVESIEQSLLEES
jgi:hypothetical protein